MRIVAINQFYWPDLAATSQLMTDLCEHLARRGHEVQVITGRSRYQSTRADLVAQEVRAGVHIHRVWATALGKRSLAHRAADAASFNASTLTALLRGPRPDAFLSLSTPPLVATLGLLAGRLRGVRLVYWVQDLYPDLALALGAVSRDSTLARVASVMSSELLRHADSVVALGPRMKELLVHNGANERRTVVIDNWSDGEAITPRPVEGHPLRASWGNPECFCAMYSGNFGMAHDFVTLTAAFERLGRRDDVMFMLVGEGSKKAALARKAADEGLNALRFLPLFPREQLGGSLTAPDVHLISLEERLSGMVVPSKVYGVMAAGRPSIYVGPRGSDVWRILDENRAGICVENGDVDGLVRAIVDLQSNPDRRRAMGKAAREAFERKFDKRHALAKWEAVLVDGANAGGIAQRRQAA